jgi:hypothetical protein
VSNESAGRHARHAVFGVKFLNCGPSASRITVSENFRRVAVEQRLDTTHICTHGQRDAFLPCLRGHDAVVGAIAKQQWLKLTVSSLLVEGSMACLAPTARCSSAICGYQCRQMPRCCRIHVIRSVVGRGLVAPAASSDHLRIDSKATFAVRAPARIRSLSDGRVWD